MLIKPKACVSISVNKIPQIQSKINPSVKAFRMIVNRFHNIFLPLISLVNDSWAYIYIYIYIYMYMYTFIYIFTFIYTLYYIYCIYGYMDVYIYYTYGYILYILATNNNQGLYIGIRISLSKILVLKQ